MKKRKIYDHPFVIPNCVLLSALLISLDYTVLGLGSRILFADIFNFAIE